MTEQNKRSSQTMPYVPVSWGELIDKITILEIKRARINAAAAVRNIRKELSLLHTIAKPALAANEPIVELMSRLRALNEILWDAEERIRVKEASSQFDDAFIELARSVYKRNDERGTLKKQINLAMGSELMEEKSYD